MFNRFKRFFVITVLILGGYRCSDSLGGLSGSSGTRKPKSTTESKSKSADSKTNNSDPNQSQNSKNKNETIPDSKTGNSPKTEPMVSTGASPNTENMTAPNNQSPFQACVFNASNVANQPIMAKVYALPIDTQAIGGTALTSSMYKTTICMPNFNVDPRRFELGFPNIPDLLEWFGIDARVKIIIPSAGLYKFRLLSDDGAILSIDNRQVINHDNIHKPLSAEGSISLTAGKHDLKILYFQGPKYAIALQLFWTPPSKQEEIVPSSAFEFKGF